MLHVTSDMKHAESTQIFGLLTTIHTLWYDLNRLSYIIKPKEKEIAMTTIRAVTVVTRGKNLSSETVASDLQGKINNLEADLGPLVSMVQQNTVGPPDLIQMTTYLCAFRRE